MATFSKKHYAAVADLLQHQFSVAIAYDQKHDTRASWERMLAVQTAFASLFLTDNPNFKPSRFIAASEPN